MTSLTVGILSWNDPEALDALLASIRLDAGHEGPILVVDNGSAEEHRPEIVTIAQRYAARHVQQPTNLGFAAGMNAVVAEAGRTDWVLLLNQDLELQPSAIKELALAAERNPDALAIGPQIHLTFQDLTFSHGTVGLFSGRLKRIASKPGVTDDYQLRASDETAEYLPGAAMLVQPDRFQDLGGFCEDYFSYWEDVEVSVRAHKAGLSLVHAPRSQVVHRHTPQGRTRGGRRPLSLYFHGRNLMHFLTTHGRGPRAVPALRHIAILGARTAADELRSKAWRLPVTRQYVAGVRDGLAGRTGLDDRARAAMGAAK